MHSPFGLRCAAEGQNVCGEVAQEVDTFSREQRDQFPTNQRNTVSHRHFLVFQQRPDRGGASVRLRALNRLRPHILVFKQRPLKN